MGQIKKCPTCGTENAASEAFCSNCNSMIASVSLSAAEVPVTESLPTQQPKTDTNGIICPDSTCGHSNPPGQNRCILCNSALNASPESDVTSANKTTEPVTTKHISTNSVPLVPYRTGGRDFLTLHEIALHFASDWDAGMSQIDDNYILKWAESNFPHSVDVDSLEFIKQFSRNRSRDHDIRLMQFIAQFAPELPPVWKGTSLTPENLIAMLEQAVNGDAKQKSRCSEIIDRDVLGAITEIRKTSDLQWCLNAFNESIESYNRAWQKVADSGGEIGAMPTPSEAGPAIMLTAISEKYQDQLRKSIKSELNKATKYCTWFGALGSPVKADAGTLIVMNCVGPQALAIANVYCTARRKKMLKLSIIPIVIAGLAAAYYMMPKNLLSESKKFVSASIKPAQMTTTNLLSAKVKGKYAYVRFEPTTNSKRVARVSNGTTVMVIKKEGDWVKCQVSDGKDVAVGWIHSTLLDI
ncbi:MAG: SH3 domain-containing protein [Desulfuromonadaceae bacterium]|nr:SH3 domain-containing protein [Desulfuromonadaceae bacterium]MDD2855802.1 SH3 domain-containing protein [Desulfuromonadaceae bacterium]